MTILDETRSSNETDIDGQRVNMFNLPALATMAQSIGSVAIRTTVIARLIKAIIAGTQIEIAAKLEGLRVMEVVRPSSSSCGGIST